MHVLSDTDRQDPIYVTYTCIPTQCFSHRSDGALAHKPTDLNFPDQQRWQRQIQGRSWRGDK